MISFSPRSVTKDLLSGLPERSRAVIVGRFGLDKMGESKTLEAIGAQYGITRERVRQIENHGLNSIRASEAYDRYQDAIVELRSAFNELGGILTEAHALEVLPKNKNDKNYIHFLMVVGDPFTLSREDTAFNRRWFTDEALATKVQEALETLHEAVDPEHLIPEEEFFTKFNSCLTQSGVKAPEDEKVLTRWLNLSKRIARNPLGEWGKADSPHVRVKSMRDYAYLTLKRHGSPMHFTEVAKGIEKLFKKKAHPATTHNELIKDSRFVLVGRGLYALKEWGYEEGVVRDVIANILKREGPLTRDEIIDRVKRERYVKDATIMVNLQDPLFVRNANGTYGLKQK